MSNKQLFGGLTLVIGVLAVYYVLHNTNTGDSNINDPHKEISANLNSIQSVVDDTIESLNLNEQIEFYGNGNVSLSWTMTSAHFATVEYGTTPALGKIAQGSTSAETEFEFNLSGIKDFETIYYKICVRPISEEKKEVTDKCTTTTFLNKNQLKAFPTAEGFGKYATGGRGYPIYKVTNLNGSGKGSFRQACADAGRNGGGNIIFNVGGTIEITDPITVGGSGNITVFGQSAPGDGILIKGNLVVAEKSNIIMRYLRFRPGTENNSNSDGLQITAWGSDNISNIIVDHCSISWAGDENLDIRSATNGSVSNVTIQNCLIAEATYGSLASKSTFNKTYYNNLFANTQERNITTNYPTDNTFDYELINNIIYGVYGAGGGAMGSKYTVLNNLYKESSEQEIYPTIIDHLKVPENKKGNGTYAETYVYVLGNIIPNGKKLISDNAISYLKSFPFLSSGIIPINANELPKRLLQDVGCNYSNRDAVDNRLITQYEQGNGQIATIGEYPNINGGALPSDSNDDGIPDDWTVTNMPRGALATALSPSGYTWLEEYLNQVDQDN